MLNRMSPGSEARGVAHRTLLDLNPDAQQAKPCSLERCQCVWPQAISGKEWVIAEAQKHHFRHWPHQ